MTASYRVIMTNDGLPEIINDEGAAIGRALTKQDGEAIVEVMNRAATTALRQRILDAVSDAIEGVFE